MNIINLSVKGMYTCERTGWPVTDCHADTPIVHVEPYS